MPLTRKKFGILILQVLSPLIIASCRQAPAEPVQAIIALDVSCPTKERLLRLANAAYQAERSLPTGSKLRVYVFGHGSVLVYSGSKITGRDSFNRKIGQFLEHAPRNLLAPGTQMDHLLALLAEDVRRQSEYAVVLVATDGGMENGRFEAMDRLRLAIGALRSANNLQRLVFVGVKPEFRKTWEDRLYPLGARASVCGDLDSDDAALNLASWVKQ